MNAQTNPKNQSFNRRLERRALILVSAVLCLALFVLYSNLNKQFETIDYDSKNYKAVNLTKGFDTEKLSELLVSGNYVSDSQDADFIAKHIADKLNKGKVLPNLGALNKQEFRIPANIAEKEGGEGLKARVASSRNTLGFDSDVLSEYANNPPSTVDLGSGDCKINVKVQETDTTANFIKRKLNRDKKLLTNVLVQLKVHYYDSLSVAQEEVLAYAMTNKNGVATFTRLDGSGYYSVLPIKEGFEYGNSKGTTSGNLGSLSVKNRTFTFTQREHTIRLFDPLTYQQLKTDPALTVRTPEQFKDSLFPLFIFFILAGWALHFYLCIRKKNTDGLLLPLLMTLTGLCFIIMNSIHNPLIDTMLGKDMAKGIITGVVLIAVISEIDFVRFYNNRYKIHFDFVLQFLRWISKIFGKKVASLVAKISDGWGYLILALTLACLLFPFGTGPEGSGVKVNLFFFQPSEITKYLILLFMAAFFSKNADKFSKLSEEVSWKSLKLQFKSAFPIIIGLAVLLGIYLVLGDMGPALVVAVTFILIYSVAKSKLKKPASQIKPGDILRLDFTQLLWGVATFGLALWVGSKLGGTVTMLAFALLWLAVWVGYGLSKKRLYESAIFMNLVIAAFIFGGTALSALGLEHAGQRLQDRNELCINTWNNELPGHGDQVAQGIWGLATGGTFGQGLGEGNPNFVSAFHTDMIFTSIGEEMGWMGLLLIVLCLAILLHRSLLIGRRAAQPFAFYLVSGIAIITGIQFLVITLGSIGLIPLTGVAVPFLSHGMTSMIINLAAFGIVFSISQKEGAPEQKEYISGYDYLVGVGSFSYIAASILLLSVLAWFQFFARDHYLIKPAYVTTQQGERIVEYNPRINQLMSRLYAGNIYDRTGRIILATNDKNAIKASDYVQAGVDNHFLENELKQRKQRYYPFGDNLFFMVGDYNSKILWTFDENNPVGYIAESQHLAALRGFNNLKPDENDKTKIKRILLTSEKYKGSTFLHKMEKEYKYTDYDYSYLLPGLKQGLNGDFVKKHNEASKNREITLTVDAELQTKMQNEMLGDVAGNFHNSKFDKMRISVVVLDAKQGDLLCSANYPLPNQDTLKNMPKVYNDQKKNFKAYTDRDLGMTYQTPPGSTAKVMSALAGLQKLGTAAANKTYFIDPREIVEVGIEPTGNAVTMEQAIRISSNNYFINLVNDNDLYASLDSIYQTVGIRLDKPATKIDKGKPVNYHKPLVPYYLAYERDMEKSEEYKVEMIAAGQKAVSKYKNYVEKRDKNRNNPAVYEKMNDGKKGWLPQHAWAWGQGTLSATPLNMARVASIVANNGNFVPTKYLLNDDSNEHLKIPAQQEIPIVSSSNANEKLREYMINEANWNVTNDRQITSVNPKNANMGGKTGTPERELYFKTYSQKRGKEVVSEVKKMNDGWYIFFIDSKKTKSPLAVAVRMERLPLGTGSGTAVRFADRVVIKTLRDLGYIE